VGRIAPAIGHSVDVGQAFGGSVTCCTVGGGVPILKRAVERTNVRAINTSVPPANATIRLTFLSDV